MEENTQNFIITFGCVSSPVTCIFVISLNIQSKKSKESVDLLQVLLFVSKQSNVLFSFFLGADLTLITNGHTELRILPWFLSLSRSLFLLLILKFLPSSKMENTVQRQDEP